MFRQNLGNGEVYEKEDFTSPQSARASGFQSLLKLDLRCVLKVMLVVIVCFYLG